MGNLTLSACSTSDHRIQEFARLLSQLAFPANGSFGVFAFFLYDSIVPLFLFSPLYRTRVCLWSAFLVRYHSVRYLKCFAGSVFVKWISRHKHMSKEKVCLCTWNLSSQSVYVKSIVNKSLKMREASNLGFGWDFQSHDSDLLSILWAGVVKQEFFCFTLHFGRILCGDLRFGSFVESVKLCVVSLRFCVRSAQTFWDCVRALLKSWRAGFR